MYCVSEVWTILRYWVYVILCTFWTLGVLDGFLDESCCFVFSLFLCIRALFCDHFLNKLWRLDIRIKIKLSSRTPFTKNLYVTVINFWCHWLFVNWLLCKTLTVYLLAVWRHTSKLSLDIMIAWPINWQHFESGQNIYSRHLWSECQFQSFGFSLANLAISWICIFQIDVLAVPPSTVNLLPQYFISVEKIRQRLI